MSVLQQGKADALFVFSTRLVTASGRLLSLSGALQPDVLAAVAFPLGVSSRQS